MEDKGEFVGPKSGIAKQLYSALQGREQEIAPSFTVERVGAAFNTNEYAVPGFFDAIQTKRPDGYVIGVGAGNIFTMLYGFGNVDPVALIMVDTDPKVVMAGKFLIHSLIQSQNADDFVARTFTLPEDEFIKQMQDLVAHEENRVLKERLGQMNESHWSEVYNVIKSGYEVFTSNLRMRDICDAPKAIVYNYLKLQALASNGNIAAVYADFTNPVLIDAVRSLPDFIRARNIIYCSNIVDQITNLGLKPDKVQQMEGLRKYEETAKSPIFVDSLQHQSYWLRAREVLPSYTGEDDINYGSFTSKPPAGTMFGK